MLTTLLDGYPAQKTRRVLGRTRTWWRVVPVRVNMPGTRVVNERVAALIYVADFLIRSRPGIFLDTLSLLRKIEESVDLSLAAVTVTSDVRRTVTLVVTVINLFRKGASKQGRNASFFL